MKKIFFLALFCCLSFLFLKQGEAEELKINVYLEKDFGYFIGDLIAVRYEIFLPENMILREDKLPKKDEELASWLELRNLKVKNPNSSTYDLALIYQVFAPGSVEKPIKIPEMEFFYGKADSSEILSSFLPAIPIWVSPLTDKNSRLQPMFFKNFVGLNPLYLKIGGGCLLVYGVVLCLLGIKNRFRPSPARKAWKELKRTEWLKQNKAKEALEIFRWMLNTMANRAIFAGNLSLFFEIMPKAQKLEKEIKKVIDWSDRLNFSPQSRFEFDENLVFKSVKNLVKNLKRREK